MFNFKRGLLRAAVTLLLLICSSLLAMDGSVVTKKLQKRISEVSDGEFIKINIAMKTQADYNQLINRTKTLDSKEKRRGFVIDELKNFSRRSQLELLTQLSAGERSGEVKDLNSLWIVNLINCRATPEMIRELSLRDDIRSIDYDKLQKGVMIDNVGKSIPIEKNSITQTKEKEITWNLTQVNGDDVWDLGYDGTGVIVSVIDTGVNYNHQDLQDHLWDGGTAYPNHGYDYINNDNDPMDDHGHGTHCAGTVAGDGTSGSQTGIAPEAKIMCMKVLTADGGGEESAVWNAVQFSVDNGAHVLSLSLGWPQELNPDNPTWRDTFNNTLAAGVISAVAAGNERGYYPAPNDCRTPGIVPPPWTHPDQTLVGGNSGVVSVGASDINDNMGSFSSTGPSTWEGETGYDDYHFNPEMGLLRPDLSAPGVNIKSLAHYSNSGYEDGWDGTSMATPLVAGVMALMLDKNINTTPAEISQILEESVYHLQIPKNNDYGSGIVDALASVNNVVSDGYPSVAITSPQANIVVAPNSIVTIEAEAEDETKSVSLVEFFINDEKIGEDNTAPYSYDWNTTGYTIGYNTIKVVATDDESHSTAREISVNLNFPFSEIYVEDFENTTNWNLTGEFEIDQPQGLGGTNYGNSDPSSAVSGSKILGVDLTGLGSNLGDYEPDLGDRAYSAESPTIDCSDYTDVTLEFQRYLNVESSEYDHAYIDIWDGSQWNQVFSNGSTLEESSWSVVEIDISDFADDNSSVKIRFSLGETDSGWEFSGWNIDDLKLKGRTNSSIGDEVLASHFSLDQNYPNPFNPVTKISYSFPTENYDNAKIVVFNTIGQAVWSSENLVNINRSSILFNGAGFNSGTYYYSLIVDGKTALTKSMILVK
jgi:serine protease AprX